ncbi:hypothetical protein HU200_013043 [Digitaria exilis]|uniref:pyruvate decarboxylase n=1 Tax=Digitaria exilis TaxID=1010633 RepID=A0A835FEB3_9POAL|nr:hypothetical protein HU200_013043 [Digitaria exilis]
MDTAIGSIPSGVGRGGVRRGSFDQGPAGGDAGAPPGAAPGRGGGPRGLHRPGRLQPDAARRAGGGGRGRHGGAPRGVLQPSSTRRTRRTARTSPSYASSVGLTATTMGSNRILHHTIGLPDFTQELRCFQTVTCYQAVVNNLEDAHEQIDTAISTAIKESKPVYISISCNSLRSHIPPLAVILSFLPLPKAIEPEEPGGSSGSCCCILEQSCQASACWWPKDEGVQSMQSLCRTSSRAPLEVYWNILGCSEHSICAEIVESADAYLFAGPYSTITARLGTRCS